MKNWKSIVSALLAGVMILSTIVTVGAANVTFTDTANHWAKSQINYLVSKDVLNGYKQSDGTYTFKPDGTVTRAEFIKMLDETFGLTSTSPINYSDVKTSDWFHPYFSKAAAQGYLLNYGTSVSPNGQLTREEATTLLVRYLGLLDAPKASSSQFTDYYSISSNFRDPVMAAVQAGLINGYKESNGTYTFRPKNTLTRAEALTILYRAAGAIYNTSAYAKDSGSADTNAVITKGGVTLSGLTLGGRVIVTEGVSGNVVTLTGCTVYDTLEIRGASNIILDKCTINAITVKSVAPEISVSLSGTTKVASMKLESKVGMTISSGSQVTEMIVDTAAKNTKITGAGSISNLSVYASGFTSTMMPTEFFVASGLSASFASKSYSGSSADQSSFTNMPYMTEEKSEYYLNLTPEEGGRIYYYFTNQSYTPTIAEFNEYFASATYKDNFVVKAGKIYSEKTYSSSQVSRFDNVVIQLVSDSRTYAPVVIDNTPTSGTGFSTDPYFDGEEIIYKTSVSGTVYYYYSDNDEEITSSEFRDEYDDKDKAMRGAEEVSANRSYSIELSSRYLSNYPFVIVVMENEYGQYYKPVIVSAGDNGFYEEPAVTTLGRVEFTPNVSGTLYYYYSRSDKMPTPQDFANNWRLEYGSSSVSVTRNTTSYINYNTTTAESYPYMVFCIRDNMGDYLTPYVLKIDYDTGFDVNPYVTGTDEVSFRAEHTGTVYWYMSRSSTMPTTETFMSAYNTAGYTRYGSVSVRSTNSYNSFTFDNSYLNQYPYIFVMLVDSSNTYYQPVMLNIHENTTTGFEEAPYTDLRNERVYFKTIGNGTVYYYFSRTNIAYSETPTEFLTSYSTARYKGSYPVTSALDYISFATYDTSAYPGIVLMYTDANNHDYYPVYLSLTSDSSSGTGSSDTGMTVTSVTDSKVTLTTETSGIIEYYFIGTPTNVSETSRVYSIYAYKNTATEISHSGAYQFMVAELDGYKSITIDLTKTSDSNNGDINDGSNMQGYGFSDYTLNPNGGVITFTGVANVDGSVSLSLSNVIGLSDTETVTAGSQFTLSIPFDIDAYLGSAQGQLIGGTIYVQLTSTNGDVYRRLEVNIGR